MTIKEGGEEQKSSDERLFSLEEELSHCRKIAEGFESDVKRYREYLNIIVTIMEHISASKI